MNSVVWWSLVNHGPDQGADCQKGKGSRCSSYLNILPATAGLAGSGVGGCVTSILIVGCLRQALDWRVPTCDRSPCQVFGPDRSISDAWQARRDLRGAGSMPVSLRAPRASLA